METLHTMSFPPPPPEHASEACKRAPNRHYFCIILVAINKARVTKMKHGVKLNRLGRASGPRRLLLRSLATELIQRERIVTTVTRAKALKSPADKVWFRSKDVCCLPCSQSLRRTTLVLGAFKLLKISNAGQLISLAKRGTFEARKKASAWIFVS